MDATTKDAWQKIITRAWSEPAFKARLLADTNEVLKEYGIDVPAGVTYLTLEDGLDGKHYLVLPPPPNDDGSFKVDSFGRDSNSGDPGF